MNKLRIKLTNISKTYRIGYKRSTSALEKIILFISGKEYKKNHQVLEDINLEISQGEQIGIIGKNGSGKSTLLRIIARIINPTNGKLKTNGKIVSILDIYAGVKSRLTTKENIYLGCSLYGLTNSQIKKRFNKIVEFSELNKFLNTKLYQFSSGMHQRLTFSIAIHCDPEILLLDDILTLGDKHFKDKSDEKIKQLVKEGSSVIRVTHYLREIEKNCNRIIIIKDNKIFKDSKNVTKTIREYENSIKKI